MLLLHAKAAGPHCALDRAPEHSTTAGSHIELTTATLATPNPTCWSVQWMSGCPPSRCALRGHEWSWQRLQLQGRLSCQHCYGPSRRGCAPHQRLHSKQRVQDQVYNNSPQGTSCSRQKCRSGPWGACASHTELQSCESQTWDDQGNLTLLWC